MIVRSTTIALWVLLGCASALAQDCRLDHANYREAQSGATLEFHAKDRTIDSPMTVALIQMRLPNVTEVYRGDVSWTNGGNTRPFGSIERQCSALDIENGLENCDLWHGSVYGLGDGTADLLLGEGEKPAPPAILLVEFGRSLYWSVAFYEANPSVGGYDVFSFTGCRP